VFSKNRDRLLDGDIAAKFLSAVLAQPTVKKLLSTDHFSVDGTLIEAWASMKSVRPKDCSSERPAEGGGHRKGLPPPETIKRRMPRPPIPGPGSTAKGEARRRSCSSWDMP
jgi:hypothetical protein